MSDIKNTKPKTKKFEFNGVIQDISRKDKGSKNCKAPHTAFTILTNTITSKQMDELVYGGCFGHKVCLKIMVIKENSEQKERERIESH